MTFVEMYNFLIDCGATSDALDLLFAVNGCTEDTGEQALYYYTGYHDFKTCMEELEEE